MHKDGITTFSMMTLNMMTFSIMTLSINNLFVTLSTNESQHGNAL